MKLKSKVVLCLSMYQPSEDTSLAEGMDVLYVGFRIY